LENASKKKQKLDCDLPAAAEVPAAVIAPDTNFHHQVLRTRLDSDGTIGRFDDISQDTPQDDANKPQQPMDRKEDSLYNNTEANTTVQTVQTSKSYGRGGR
jgi:hypothetical protein